MSVAFEGKCSGCGNYFSQCTCSVSPSPLETYTGEPFVTIDSGLIERVKAIRNQCDMFLMLQGMDGASRVIATLLEDLHYRSQLIIDEYCTRKDD